MFGVSSRGQKLVERTPADVRPVVAERRGGIEVRAVAIGNLSVCIRISSRSGSRPLWFGHDFVARDGLSSSVFLCLCLFMSVVRISSRMFCVSWSVQLREELVETTSCDPFSDTQSSAFKDEGSEKEFEGDFEALARAQMRTRTELTQLHCQMLRRLNTCSWKRT